jgi:hypothetical protein
VRFDKRLFYLFRVVESAFHEARLFQGYSTPLLNNRASQISRAPNRTVARQPKLWQNRSIVKTLEIEDIYADPHKLDSFIDSGESVQVVRDGRAIAELVPRTAAVESGATSKWPPIDFHARFLRMWGPDAFHSEAPMADLFDELRRQREL